MEALFPVLNEWLRARVWREVVEPLELDDSRVCEMNEHGQYRRRESAPEQPAVDGQQLAQDTIHAG